MNFYAYSQVPNRRISLIKEYHEYFPIVINKYYLKNEYVGKTHDKHKQTCPNKQI